MPERSIVIVCTNIYKTKQLSDFEFGKLFLIYINFLLDYLI